jgi:hypothetical protein
MLSNTVIIEASDIVWKGGSIIEIFCPSIKSWVYTSDDKAKKCKVELLPCMAQVNGNTFTRKKIHVANKEYLTISIDPTHPLWIESSWQDAESSFAEVLHAAGVPTATLPKQVNGKQKKQIMNAIKQYMQNRKEAVPAQLFYILPNCCCMNCNKKEPRKNMLRCTLGLVLVKTNT